MSVSIPTWYKEHSDSVIINCTIVIWNLNACHYQIEISSSSHVSRPPFRRFIIRSIYNEFLILFIIDCCCLQLLNVGSMTKLSLAIASYNVKFIYKRHPFFLLFVWRKNIKGISEHQPMINTRRLTLVKPKPMMMKIGAHCEVFLPFFWHLEPNVVKLFHPVYLFFNRSHFVIALVIGNCWVINHVLKDLIVVVNSWFIKKTVAQIFNVKVAISSFFNKLRGSDFIFPTASNSLFSVWLGFHRMNLRSFVFFHLIK